MLSRRHLIAALALLPLAACAATPSATPSAPAAATAASAVTVVVYAPGAMAAHTKPLAAAYAEAGLGTVSFEVGHTPIQREQLAKGATPDVWIAANPADMQTTAGKGLVDADRVTQLARTKLVVVVAPDNPGNVAALTDLGREGVSLLVGAETLPIWAATEKTLDKLEDSQGAGFKEKVLANVVSREMGVQPIVTKVTMGEADAGIVFVTDVPADRKGLTTLDIPDGLNTLLPLSMAPVTAGTNAAGATAFLEFMTAGPGRAILDEAGYLPPAA